MSTIKRSFSYSVGEEVFNAVTHGIGVLLGIWGFSLLVIKAIKYTTVIGTVSVTVFGFTMVVLYLASTLYHSIASRKIKPILKIIDHSSIFLLIAGTYTPFTLITLQGPWGWSIFVAVWTLAFVGIFLEVLPIHKSKVFSLVLYLLMGWIVVVAIVLLIRTIPRGGLYWLVAGGLSYTFGSIFYMMKRYRYTHGVWHLFVLFGTIAHFFAVYFYVLPTS